MAIKLVNHPNLVQVAIHLGNASRGNFGGEIRGFIERAKLLNVLEPMLATPPTTTEECSRPVQLSLYDCGVMPEEANPELFPEPHAFLSFRRVNLVSVQILDPAP